MPDTYNPIGGASFHSFIGIANIIPFHAVYFTVSECGYFALETLFTGMLILMT